MTNTSVSMLLYNHGQPFVTARLAERVAIAVVEEKHPRDVFAVDLSTPAEVVDHGEFFTVTLRNAIPAGTGIAPGAVRLDIRKENAEVLRMRAGSLALSTSVFDRVASNAQSVFSGAASNLRQEQEILRNARLAKGC